MWLVLQFEGSLKALFVSKMDGMVSPQAGSFVENGAQLTYKGLVTSHSLAPIPRTSIAPKAHAPKAQKKRLWAG